jgi:hypothetical protein
VGYSLGVSEPADAGARSRAVSDDHRLKDFFAIAPEFRRQSALNHLSL